MSFFKKLFKKEEDNHIESYQDFWGWFLLHEKEFYKVVKKGNSDKIAANFFDKIAPKLDEWKFRALKPEHEIKNVGINMAGFSFTSENIFFYANDLKDCPDEIDITIIHDDYNEENKAEIINGCYLFLDHYLGELNSLTIIDNINFKEKGEVEKELIPIEKLKSFIIWREKEFVEK